MIAVLFASCKKTKTYSTQPSITIYNSKTKSNEPNVKLALMDGGIILQQGRTDTNGNFSFSEFPATEGHVYEIKVYLGCGEGECHIRNGSHANYSYTITPANNTSVNCTGIFFPNDTMRVVFKHKYFAELGNGPDAVSWFYASSNVWGANSANLVAYTGEYYVTIYKFKSGVFTTTYDTVVVPTPTSCVPSCVFNYPF